MILMACEQTVKLGSRRLEAVDSILKEWRSLNLESEEEIRAHLKKQNTLDSKIDTHARGAGAGPCRKKGASGSV